MYKKASSLKLYFYVNKLSGEMPDSVLTIASPFNPIPLFKNSISLLTFKNKHLKKFEWSMLTSKNKFISVFILSEVLKFFKLKYLKKNVKYFSKLYFVFSYMLKWSGDNELLARIIFPMFLTVYKRNFLLQFNKIANQKLVLSFIYTLYIWFVRNRIKLVRLRHYARWNFYFILSHFTDLRKAHPPIFVGLFLIDSPSVFDITVDDDLIWSYINRTNWHYVNIDIKKYKKIKYLKTHEDDVWDIEDLFIDHIRAITLRKLLKLREKFEIANYIEEEPSLAIKIENSHRKEEQEGDDLNMKYYYNPYTNLLILGIKNHFKLFYDFSQIYNVARPATYSDDLKILLKGCINQNKKLSSGLRKNMKLQQNFSAWRFYTHGYKNKIIFNLRSTVNLKKFKTKKLYRKFTLLKISLHQQHMKLVYNLIEVKKNEDDILKLEKRYKKNLKSLNKDIESWAILQPYYKRFYKTFCKDHLDFLSGRFKRRSYKVKSNRFYPLKENWVSLNGKWVNIYEIIEQKKETGEWEEAMQWERDKNKRLREYFDELDNTPPTISPQASRQIYTKLLEKYKSKQEEENFKNKFIYSENIGYEDEEDYTDNDSNYY